MSPFAHWTPRYAVDRLAALIYQWTHPDAPWLTPQSIQLLEAYLAVDHIGAEWGTGRSTRWLAQRVAGLIAIEHDPAWYERVERSLQKLGHHGVTLVRARQEAPAYLDPVHTLEDGILDFVIVDGRRRGECALVAIPKLRSGGVLVVDDAHRYLPNQSRAPHALKGEEEMEPEWQRFAKQTAQWESTWTTDGLRDTVIFVKP